MELKPGASAADKSFGDVTAETLFNSTWLIEQIMENFIAFIIVSIIGISIAYYKGWLSRFVRWFCTDNFPLRKDFFTYHQRQKQSEVKSPSRDHLVQRSLLGVITVPATYGRFNTSGSQVKFAPTAINTSVMHKDTQKFIKRCIVDFCVDLSKAPHNKNTGAESLQKVNSVDSSFIAQSVFLKAISEHEPQMIAITGKVGCGKSTLVHSLGNFFGNNNKILPSKVAFLVIDVRQLLEKRLELSLSFHKSVVDGLFVDTVIGAIKLEVVRLLCSYKISEIEKDTDFNSAIEICYKYNISVIVSLDELDHLYTVFARHTLTHRGDPQRMYEERYRKLFEALCSFHREVPISSATRSANTLVLLVARSSTIRLIDEVIGGRPIRDSYRIEISNTDCFTISEIIKRQVDVIVSGVSGEEKQLLQELSRKLGAGEVDFNKNIKVSVHGMRHLINAIAKLSDPSQFNGKDGYKLLARITSSPGLLRLYQYIDGNPDYSQAEEGISNIFLVNKDPASQDSSSAIEENEDREWLFNDHLQSYWLKYFICQYIVKMHYDQNKMVNFGDVVDLFVSRTKKTSNHYEESIIKLALLHASKVDHGRLIKFGFDRGITVIPAARLNYMLDEHIFWDFGYLMVVIEDKWIEFPKEIFKEMKKNPEYTVHKFLTRYHESTRDYKESFVIEKAEKSLRFYLVLKAGLYYEKQRCSSVFESLQELGINIDPMDEFYDHLKASIREFTRKHVDDLAVGKVDRVILEFEREQKSEQKRLSEIFRRYHRHPPFRGIDSKMKLYHHERETCVD